MPGCRDKNGNFIPTPACLAAVAKNRAAKKKQQDTLQREASTQTRSAHDRPAISGTKPPPTTWGTLKRPGGGTTTTPTKVQLQALAVELQRQLDAAIREAGAPPEPVEDDQGAEDAARREYERQVRDHETRSATVAPPTPLPIDAHPDTPQELKDVIQKAREAAYAKLDAEEAAAAARLNQGPLPARIRERLAAAREAARIRAAQRYGMQLQYEMGTPEYRDYAARRGRDIMLRGGAAVSIPATLAGGYIMNEFEKGLPDDIRQDSQTITGTLNNIGAILAGPDHWDEIRDARERERIQVTRPVATQSQDQALLAIRRQQVEDAYYRQLLANMQRRPAENRR